jgi:tRNA modification GTPase
MLGDPRIEETIVAVATAPGRGGVGIVRLSGDAAVRIAGELVELKGRLEQGRARFGWVRDVVAEGDSQRNAAAGRIDEALVTAFYGPRSYTGETVVEIATHGAPVVLEAVVRGAIERGARLAEPGEFTQRAFLSGRMDLTQAEAVRDLIAAKTLDQARVAAQQMGGALARRVATPKETLLRLIGFLEAGMDFASGELDDVEVIPREEIAAQIAAAEQPLQELAETFRRGQLMRDGASIALVGLPNAGKSSLFNRLLERERSIVTPMAGTTRDTVEESVALAGVPVRLVDTAGLRDMGAVSIDVAEALGIGRSREAMAEADVVVVVHDASLPMSWEETRLIAELQGEGLARPYVLVFSKIDLVDAGSVVNDADMVGTSAVTGHGLIQLRGAILERLGGAGSVMEAGMLNNARQQDAVREAVTALTSAAAANRDAMPHEVLLMDLHGALRALDSLTGTTTTEDILGRIFSTFCIGK